jgi:cbb3-type cytochrome c oxidase subunit III
MRRPVQRSANVWAMVWVAFSLLVGGCSVGGERIEDHPCPPGGTQWTYDNFGASFMARHCETCHATNAEPRNGAPSNITLDTRADVLRWRDRIFENAADDNTSMPPGPNDPPVAERQALADWLACGAP